MITEQIFADAVEDCPKIINREFIAGIIAKDTTKTIRNYLNSYGIVHLARFLQETALNVHRKQVMVNVRAHIDPNQKFVQDAHKPKKKSKGGEEQNYTNLPKLKYIPHAAKIEGFDGTDDSLYNTYKSSYAFTINADAPLPKTNWGVMTNGTWAEPQPDEFVPNEGGNLEFDEEE